VHKGRFLERQLSFVCVPCKGKLNAPVAGNERKLDFAGERPSGCGFVVGHPVRIRRLQYRLSRREGRQGTCKDKGCNESEVSARYKMVGEAVCGWAYSYWTTPKRDQDSDGQKI